MKFSDGNGLCGVSDPPSNPADPDQFAFTLDLDESALKTKTYSISDAEAKKGYVCELDGKKLENYLI